MKKTIKELLKMINYNALEILSFTLAADTETDLQEAKKMLEPIRNEARQIIKGIDDYKK